MPIRRPSVVVPVVLVAAALAVAACTVDDAAPSPSASSGTPSPSPTPLAARLTTPAAPVTVLPATTPESAALDVVRALVERAPVVLVADAADASAQEAAVAESARLGAPVLLTGPGAPPDALAAELDRLGTRWVVVAGAADPPDVDGARVVALEDAADLPRTAPPEPLDGTVLLTGVTAPLAVAAADAALAGAAAVDVPGGDPRATSGAVRALAERRPAHVLALGEAFGPPERLATRVATAATGVELPGGGQLVFPAVPGLPGKKYVALYGTPGTPALGVLGEQDVPATIARAQAHADGYRALTGDTVVPTVEIIATIASAGAGPDGNYSQERSVEELRPLVEAAGAAGQTVVLDLQPGRTDFLTQAQLYADLLALPHVGLALDPEWRLAPDQVHLRQIGSVGVDEVNAVAAWLADFTAQRALPQKMLVLHQFSLRMIQGRERLDTSRDELAVLIHADGQGTQPAKAGTWQALRAGAPAVHWGWKNFYDEDVPMLDPVQTYAVQPVPDLVTYQ